MCLIIDRPPNLTVPENILERGLDDNPHGWGIVFASGGKLVTLRGLHDDDFYHAYADVPDNVHCTIHFRWATHGTVGVDNCHPFEHGRFAVAHNGVMSRVPIRFQDRSDTWHFVNDTLGPFLERNPHIFESRAARRRLGAEIGAHNKLVIMRDDGRRYIINRGSGVDHRGLWLSNSNPLMDFRSKWSAWSAWRSSTRRGWDEFDDIDAELPDRCDGERCSAKPCWCHEDALSMRVPVARPYVAPSVVGRPPVTVPADCHRLDYQRDTNSGYLYAIKYNGLTEPCTGEADLPFAINRAHEKWLERKEMAASRECDAPLCDCRGPCATCTEWWK